MTIMSPAVAKRARAKPENFASKARTMSSPTATCCISASRTRVRRQSWPPNRLFSRISAKAISPNTGSRSSAADIVTFAKQLTRSPSIWMTRPRSSVAGRLIASGWHAAALLLRMNCDAFLLRVATPTRTPVDPLSVEEIKWIRPVRPDDRLHVRRTVLSARSAGSDAGEIAFLFELVDQEGIVATSQQSALTLLTREAGSR